MEDRLKIKTSENKEDSYMQIEKQSNFREERQTDCGEKEHIWIDK